MCVALGIPVMMNAIHFEAPNRWETAMSKVHVVVDKVCSTDQDIRSYRGLFTSCTANSSEIRTCCSHTKGAAQACDAGDTWITSLSNTTDTQNSVPERC